MQQQCSHVPTFKHMKKKLCMSKIFILPDWLSGWANNIMGCLMGPWPGSSSIAWKTIIHNTQGKGRSSLLSVVSRYKVWPTFEIYRFTMASTDMLYQLPENARDLIVQSLIDTYDDCHCINYMAASKACLLSVLLSGKARLELVVDTADLDFWGELLSSHAKQGHNIVLWI